MTEQVMAYRAIKSCGLAVGIVADRNKDLVAKALAEWARAGFAIERVTIEEARATELCFGDCPECRQSASGS